MFGVAGFDQTSIPSWLHPALIVLLLINVACAWVRGWVTGRISGQLFVTAGAATILASRSVADWEGLAPWGVVCVVLGSVICATGSRQRELRAAAIPPTSALSGKVRPV